MHNDRGSTNAGISTHSVSRGVPFSGQGIFSIAETGGPNFASGYGRGSGPSGESVWLPGIDYRLRKLKMPEFNGEDAYGWVYRIEWYFDIQGFVTTGEKLRAVVLCFEGQTLSWYRWSDDRCLGTRRTLNCDFWIVFSHHRKGIYSSSFWPLNRRGPRGIMLCCFRRWPLNYQGCLKG